MMTLPLTRHPAFPCPYVRAFTVSITHSALDRLTLGYRIAGAIDDLRLPEPAPAGFADGLWKHTCLEAFVRAPSGRPYYELNFSPSGQWAVYRFDDYRQGMTRAPAAAPKITCTQRQGAFEADVEVARSAFEDAGGGELRVGLCAVLEDRHGQFSYWALEHAGAKPDFHHAGGFTLTLPAPAGERR